MKKYSLSFLLISVMAFFTVQCHAQRFLSEVFPSAMKTQSVTYASNFSVLTGAPVLENLTMDVYEPGGVTDPMLHRPLIILMHPGLFLPTYINMSPTGSRTDSAIVEMCTRFAKRGYVVAAMSYRLGNNPYATGGGINSDIRKGTLVQAVYRAMQDAKCCVRFFREDEATTNTFKIDSNKVILGGSGSGGFVSLAYAALDNFAEIAIPEFLSSNNVGAPYNYISGQPYINIAQQGDFDGYGGNASFNFPNNSPGHTNNVQFVFNIGGALCDSSWMEPGNAPMVAFQVTGDPYTPYNTGIAIVPSSLDTLMQVSGSNYIIPFADQAGNNNCFINAGFTDVYTQHANTLNNGYDGLYPFATIPSDQVAPWEWYDSLATVAGAQAVGVINGGDIFHNAVLDNPGMSKARALAYIDTIMNYLNPRIVYCLNLVTGIHSPEVLNNSVDIYPNPAPADFFVTIKNKNELISSIELSDVTGKTVRKVEKINNNYYKMDRENISPGIYFLKVWMEKKIIVRKIILE
ncbi:MAG TPA: T9SS type A sorting domain-containing protein [Bacteroidia bacterium]|nr:T9SS type A sorting domain-containing protein [Bacteroidia bacterium]